MHPPPGGVRQASLCVPAHAHLGRHPREQADRPRMGEDAEAGLATTAHGQLQCPGLRRAAGGRPGQRRLDRDLFADRHRVQRHGGGGGKTQATGRFPQDGIDTCTRGRAGPRQGRGRGAQALLQRHVQAAGISRQLPADVQPAECHPGRHARPGGGAHHGIRRGGERPGA
ncbi:hypothetical protein D3C78_1057880 [compost metagenome]